jgi:hypothetical protein
MSRDAREDSLVDESSDGIADHLLVVGQQVADIVQVQRVEPSRGWLQVLLHIGFGHGLAPWLN